jgi:hypothetical protein
MTDTLPIPRALYPCHHCYEEYSWHADDLHWSPLLKAWVCNECWNHDVHGEPGIRLDHEIKRQTPVMPEYDQPAQAKRQEAAWQRMQAMIKVPACPESGLSR